MLELEGPGAILFFCFLMIDLVKPKAKENITNAPVSTLKVTG